MKHESIFSQWIKNHVKWLEWIGIKKESRVAILPAMWISFLLLFILTSCGEVCQTVDDDSAIPETIVRDNRDQSYGALSNSEVRPLGGGEGYSKIVPRPSDVFNPAVSITTPPTALGVVVRTGDELRTALHSGLFRTIYIDDAAEIDLSYCSKTPNPGNCADPRSGPADCGEFSLTIPQNVTLASGRGGNGSRGALLFSRTFTECPLLSVQGEGVRITGLRIHGPDSSIENDDPIHCNAEAIGIGIMGDTALRWATEIDNNELSSWPRAAVQIIHIRGVRVHHNVIQFNRRKEDNGTCGKDYGFGLGVVNGPGSVIVEANVFDHNRHDIASNGKGGSYYTATYNLILTGAVEQSFDVHGGVDRKDCTNMAGSAFVVHHNTFLQSHKPAVEIRGVPLIGMWIYKNETIDDDEGHAFDQENDPKGNFFVDDNLTHIDRFPAWFISFGGSTFWQWRQFESQDMNGVAAVDFDGDGVNDVMRSTSTGWQWSRGAREGWAFLNTNTDLVSQLAFGHFVRLKFTDVIRATGSEWQVSEGGTSSWRSLYTTTDPLSSAAFGDFEGDNKTDAFFSDGTQWTIVESYSPQVIRRHYSEPYKLSELRFGNFVGDSKVDVLRSTGNEWLVWDYVSKTWNHLAFTSIPLSELVFADFDGDGFTDIARSNDGKWFVSWGGRSQWQLLNTSDLDLRSQLIADFNGDHKADVLSQQSPEP